MRVELIPILIGFLVAVVGLGLIADAWLADGTAISTERRRRRRAERHRVGEGIVGAGTFCVGAALIGRDTWRFGTLAVILGALLLITGAVLNRAFLKEALAFRGSARRSLEGTPAAPPPSSPEPRRRIRLR